MKKIIVLLLIPFCLLGLIKKAKCASEDYVIRFDYTSFSMPVGGNIYDYLPEAYVYDTYNECEETREDMIYSYEFQGIKIENIDVTIASQVFFYMSAYNAYYECPYYLQRINVTIYDDVKPTIQVNDIVSISYKEEFNPNTYITYTDNASTPCNVIVEGSYSKKVGEYNLKAIVTDASGNESTKKFKLVVYDRIKPTIISDDVILLNIGEDFNPSDYIKAVDEYDGLLDFSLSEYDITTLGEKTITISAVDKSGNTETKDIILNVIDRVSPTINLKEEELNVMEDYNLYDNIISVNDNLDNLSVSDVLIETKKVGTKRFLVTYSISDISGNVTIKEVYENVTYKNSPIIEAVNLDNLEDYFDPLNYVNCHDVEDGNLNDKVMVVELNYDEKYGIYEVYDSDGNVTRVRINYVEKDELDNLEAKSKIVFPTVDEVNETKPTEQKNVNEYKTRNYNFLYYIVLGIFIICAIIFIIVKHFRKKKI